MVLLPLGHVRRATLSPTCQAQGRCGLLERFKGAADLDAAVAIANEAGFDVGKGDWLKLQQTLELSDDFELSDQELESVAGSGCSRLKYELGGSSDGYCRPG